MAAGSESHCQVLWPSDDHIHSLLLFVFILDLHGWTPFERCSWSRLDCIDDSKHLWLRYLSRPRNSSRYFVCSSIWLGAETTRRTAISANGPFPMAFDDTHSNHLAPIRQDIERSPSRARGSCFGRSLPEGRRSRCTRLCII